MNIPLIGHLFGKREPLPLSFNDIPMRGRDGQFSPSPKTMARLNRKASVNGLLAVYNATTPLEKRKAETEEFFARASQSRSLGRGDMGKGL